MSDILLSILLPCSLAIIMLGMGMSLTLRDFSRIFRQPKAAILGIINQTIIFPLTAFCLAILFNLDTNMAIGLIILASCPGGPTSNIITQICDGNIALSVTLTAVISFISIVSTQVTISYALTYFNTFTDVQIELPFLKTLLQITTVTVIPISIGMLIKNYFPNFSSRMIKPMRTASTIIFILILTGIIATNYNTIGNAIHRVGWVTLLLNLSIISSGFLLAKIFKLNFKDAIAIGVDGGIQNATLAIVISTTMLQSIELAIPTAAYSIWMYLSGGALMLFFSKKNSIKKKKQTTSL